MPATIVITCPKCKKELKGPPELEGKKIRCKGCGTMFTAQASAAAKTKPGPVKPPAKGPPPKGASPKGAPPKAAPPPKKPHDDDDDDDPNPYGMVNENLAPRCPHCAQEMESEDAVICLHCGFNTQNRTQGATRRVKDITGFDKFLWLLPGILCAMGTLFLIGLTATIWILRKRLIANAADEWYSSLVSPGIVWTSFMNFVIAWRLTVFAINRLIKHPHPPEKEVEE